MTRIPDDPTGKKNSQAEEPGDVIKQWWDDLLFLPHQPMSLSEIYATAEKLIQYCRIAVREEGVEWLKRQIEAAEQAVSAEIAADPDNLDRKRVHAALAGAQAGFAYPLGWSPRDLNHMVF